MLAGVELFLDMKRTHIITLILGIAGACFAGPDKGKVVVPEPCEPFYVALFGGGSFFDSGESSTSPQFLPHGIALTDEYDFEDGWIFGGAVGIRTAGNFRMELELSHSQAPGDTYSFLAETPYDSFSAAGALRGDVERTSLMFNVAKEFGSGRLHPYIGGGVGVTYVDVDLVGAVDLDFIKFLGGLPAIGVPGFGDSLVFGYQAMAGLSFDVTDCLDAFVEYRIMGHGDQEDYLRILPGDLDLGWSQHVILGVRMGF